MPIHVSWTEYRGPSSKWLIDWQVKQLGIRIFYIQLPKSDLDVNTVNSKTVRLLKLWINLISLEQTSAQQKQLHIAQLGL